MLHIDSISKTFDGKVILDNVNLKIGNSELKILKGKNGSGKTTFLKIIASLMSYNNGKIFFNNIENCKKTTLRKNIFYLGDVPGFYKFLSPLQNIELGLSLRKSDVPKEKIILTLKKFELSNYINKPVGIFSKGMLQRLKFAYAFLLDWKVGLLDEPLNGLDDEGVKLFNECIKIWIENKQSVLLVTHNTDYITNSNYDILYLKNKKISS
ncbi:MAG: ABC transporter ATP-binding protein [bacterium TMED144]|nr:MAG: ABC transporter ATP-binding protein [bacterium TMED144]|tara:strand:- start:733 stop:1362 length:630 start_codon:yes stop_codon:yes gene_type:complete